MSKHDHDYHKPTEEGMKRIERVRTAIIELDTLLDQLVLDAGFASDQGVPYVPGESMRDLTVAHARLRECRQNAISAIVFRFRDGGAAYVPTVDPNQPQLPNLCETGPG